MISAPRPLSWWLLITLPCQFGAVLFVYILLHSAISPCSHVPSGSLSSFATFLLTHPCHQDYGNPRKWAEPGFAAFIVAVCCLASRHIDDPRVRSDPSEGVSAGTQWFELFGRLRTLPIADRLILYII